MRSDRHSLQRLTQALQRRLLGHGDRTLAEPKCLACGQVVDPVVDQSPEQGETVVAFPYSVERANGKVPKKRPSSAIGVEDLLHLSRQLYAHALTLQEVVRSGGEKTYEALKPRYDRQAAQQFEIFYRTFERPSGFRKPDAGSCE